MKQGFHGPAGPSLAVVRHMARRILILDKEEFFLFTLREYFSLLGYQVDCDKAAKLLGQSSDCALVGPTRCGMKTNLEEKR